MIVIASAPRVIQSVHGAPFEVSPLGGDHIRLALTGRTRGRHLRLHRVALCDSCGGGPSGDRVRVPGGVT